MKNIFITGGNRGIGKGLVEIFSENYKSHIKKLNEYRNKK